MFQKLLVWLTEKSKDFCVVYREYHFGFFVAFSKSFLFLSCYYTAEML